MDSTVNKDQLMKAIKDQLFQKFVNEFDMVLMDFKNKDKILITESFLKMARLAIDPVMLSGDTTNNKEIKGVYLEELIKKFKKDFIKVDQIRLNKYFTKQEMFSHFSDKQFDILQQLESLNEDPKDNEKLSNEIFCAFMTLTEKYLSEMLPKLYIKVETVKSRKAIKTEAENNKIKQLTTWQGSNDDFLKLIYALYYSNHIDQQKEISVVAKEFAQVMGVEFPDDDNLNEVFRYIPESGQSADVFFDVLKKSFQTYLLGEEK